MKDSSFFRKLSIFNMVMRGHRFALSTEDDFLHSRKSVLSPSLGLVSDIKERDVPSDAKEPSPPKLKSSSTGFPSHKGGQASRFQRKKQLSEKALQSSKSAAPQTQISHPSNSKDCDSEGQNDVNNAKENIDTENRQRLAGMSEEEIAQAQQELLTSLSPSLIEKLLKKAQIEDDETTAMPTLASNDKALAPLSEDYLSNVIKSSNQIHAIHSACVNQESDLHSHVDPPPSQLPADLHPVSSKEPLPPPPEIHFPKRPAPPELDPNDPDFLTKLHSTYIPSLPSDPSAL